MTARDRRTRHPQTAGKQSQTAGTAVPDCRKSAVRVPYFTILLYNEKRRQLPWLSSDIFPCRPAWKKEKKTAPRKTYDKETRKPAIRVSICSGEKVAGFQEINSGKFHEIQLIRTDADLEEFLESYGLKKEEVATIY